MNLKNLTQAVVAILLLAGFTATATAKDIIHDSEHYILQAQHGIQWAKEDEDIQKKLDALKKKHGRPPNIIHIMWDDTAVGEIGIPQIQAGRGFSTPNMNQFAAEG